MQLVESSEFVHLHSPFLALACVKRFPMMAQLGVESGGRLKRHIEQNLLKPGLGGTAVYAGQSSWRQPCTLEHSARQLVYHSQGVGLDWRILFPDERTFVVRLHRPAGRMGGEFFRVTFSPAVCPVSVWGDWLSAPPYPTPQPASCFDLPKIIQDYRLPLLLHFPDYGALKVTCADLEVFARQTFSADPAEMGLNLGCLNTYHHTHKRAYHAGQVEVSFHLRQEAEEVELVFQVEPEHYPQIEGADFSGPQWNGLKRCWQNSFTLNPENLSMGDNIVLSGIAHLAIHYKSDLAVFTPPLVDGLTLHKFFRRVLEITFRDCVGENGEINSRYAGPNRNQPSRNFSFFDTNISNLIALYNHVATSGDWTLVRDHRENICRVGRFLLAWDQDDDGLLELPFDGNGFREDRECRNWWDNFSFGHKDAFLNLLAYRGLGHLAELLEGVGASVEARPIVRLRERFAANFHRVFFNPTTGVYAGWISADGCKHDYMFTFISAMAINAGLVEPESARRILLTLLDKLRAEGYGHWRWGIPGPLLSVTESDRHIWEPMQRWGSYENGGLCGQTAYHFLQALYQTGLRAEADEILFAMLDTFEHEFTHSGVFPGYMRSVDWRTKEGIPCGYNYLADNYYFLLAAVTGHFGLKLPRVGRPG